MYLSISLSWENISMIFMWIWDPVSFWYLSQTRIMFGISDQLQVLEPFQILVNTIQYHFVSSGDGLTNLLNSYPKQPFTKWVRQVNIYFSISSLWAGPGHRSDSGLKIKDKCNLHHLIAYHPHCNYNPWLSLLSQEILHLSVSSSMVSSK